MLLVLHRAIMHMLTCRDMCALERICFEAVILCTDVISVFSSILKQTLWASYRS